MTPPGCSTQCHSKKGRRCDRASPELRRNARGRQKQARPVPTAPGAGEAQRAATWHMRGATSAGRRGLGSP